MRGAPLKTALTLPALLCQTRCARLCAARCARRIHLPAALPVMKHMRFAGHATMLHATSPPTLNSALVLLTAQETRSKAWRPHRRACERPLVIRLHAESLADPIMSGLLLHAQLLAELGAACEPFARPLQRIQQELARAVFSSFYASEDGTLGLRQLPYFAVVARLETEKANLIADRDAARDALGAQKVPPACCCMANWRSGLPTPCHAPGACPSGSLAVDHTPTLRFIRRCKGCYPHVCGVGPCA